MKTFKDVFKYYKSKSSKLDLSEVYDFYQSSGQTHQTQDVEKVLVHAQEFSFNWETVYGMKQPKDWDVFTFSSKPGLIYIRNPFKPCGQRYWIARSLKDFTKKPNCLNIDPHNLIKKDEDWWEFCVREHQTEQGLSVLKKLRWATLGYHHNWDTKVYSDDLKGEFPEDLNNLCHDIALALGFQDFNAEAAIINMYHIDSNLSGHTDHSEVDLEAPLFSFSFGESAIFLIGGKTIEEVPIPILLQSGDIVVMSQEARLCYHGVPRILNSRIKSWSIQSDEDDIVLNSCVLDHNLLKSIKNAVFWQPFELYVSESRINMNVRQVLLKGQKKLNNMNSKKL